MQGKRRVAILINDMNAAGGIQRVAANLARDLAPHYDTMVLAVEPLDSPVFHEPGMEYRSLGYPRSSAGRIGLVRDLVQVGRLMRRFVAENRIDTVLCIWYDWASVAAFALPASVKKIGCEHISYDEATRKWRWIRARSYPRLDAVVGLTNEDLPRLAAISRSAHVIPNATRAIEPTPAEGREKILLTVGHLVGRKGIDRLLWSLKEPLLENPDWKLVVVGGGEKGHTDWGYLDYLSVLINLLQLEGRVEFHQATRRIDDWYRRASAYVMGSRREGLPMVLIEAKAHGLPILSFNCPTGPKEIVRHGIDGFLIDDDGEEFAEAARSLMRDPDLRHRMSAAAVEDVRQRFSTAAVTAQWVELIEGLHRGASAAVQGSALPRRADA